MMRAGVGGARRAFIDGLKGSEEAGNDASRE